jgi:hypothetical protein
MAINYATLKTELETDPNGYGYAEWIAVGNDQKLADLLNQSRSAIRIRRADVGGAEIMNVIAVADLVNNPGAAQVQWFNRACDPLQTLRLLNDDGTETPVRANFIGLVRSGTPTLQRLASLETRDGSRAEQLFGANTFVSSFDVAQALRG